MRRKRILAHIYGLLLFFLLWSGVALLVRRPFLPPPWQVLPLFVSLLPGELGFHLLASTTRVLSAMTLAVLLAAPAGLLLGQLRHLDRIITPLISILYPIPKVVFLPVLYLFLGLGDLTKILLLALILFFQVLVVVRDRSASIPQELILSVRSLGAGRRALLRFVYLPATLPAMLTALRVSVGTALAVLFFIEQSLTTWGLGYYIVVKSYQVLRYREMYAGILAISLLGLTFYFALGSLERLLTPGNKQEDDLA